MVGTQDFSKKNAGTTRTNSRVKSSSTLPVEGDDFDGLGLALREEQIEAEQTELADLKQRSDIIPEGTFKDNILSMFDNITYNFRLYMSTETTTHESLAFDDVIVIAETGSTGFNIIDVQMDTIISPSKATKNTFATNVVVKLVEPFGTSLLDYIRNSAAELGVFDHRRVPIWLDLRFKGYNGGDDDSFEGGDPVALSEQTRTWKLRVKNIDIEMTKGGTEYTMHLISQDESALEDSARLLENDVHIKASTIGDFLKKLAVILNKYTNYDTTIQEDSVESVRRYKFALPGDPIEIPVASRKNDVNATTDVTRRESLPVPTPMKDWKIRGNANDKTVKTSPFVQEKDKNGVLLPAWQVTFKKGTSIESIIQQIIGSTDEGQSLLLFGEQNKKIGSNERRNPVTPSIAFMVDPTVFLFSYNKIAKAYNIEITYNIRQYKTYIPTVTREHIDDSQSIKSSKERLKNKLKISKIKKKYNYMFTGENTEVLDYKVELNSTWFISLPIFRGQDRNAQAVAGRTSAITSGKGQPGQVDQTKKKPLVETIQSLRKKKKQLQEDIDIQSEAGVVDTQAEAELRDVQSGLTAAEIKAKSLTNIPLNSGQSALDTNSFSAKDKLRRIKLTTDAAEPGTVSGNIPNTTVIGNTPEIDVIRQQRRAPASNGNSRGSIFFAEDFGNFNDDDATNKDDDENIQINNIGSQVSPTTSTGESNVEGVRDADRSFFSAAMNQIYGFKGQLITLDLEIRGDPYWLGEPNAFKRLTNAIGFDDLTKADSLLVLTFKFPVAIDDGGDEDRDNSYNGTGLYNLKRQENGFNGVYYVTKVENSFSGGRFTQRLTGYIDPLTKEQDLISELDKNGI